MTSSAPLQRLAIGLAGSADADDLVQETFLATLTHPPDEDREAEPWMRSVLINRFRMQRRSATRREAREQEVATRGDAATIGDVEEQWQTVGVIRELVDGLEEPYRTVVLLRYFEGRSAADIARLQDVPAGTVRWRLKIALDELRVALEDRPTSRAQVLAFAALPLSHTAESTLLSTLTKLFMAHGLKITTGAALAALVAFYTWPSEAKSPAPESPAASQLEPAGASPEARQAHEATSVPTEGPAYEKLAPAAQDETLDPQERAVFQQRVAEAQALRRHNEAETGPKPFNRKYVRESLKEVLPLVRECWALGLEEQPDLAGRVAVRFKISGDPDVGGLIELAEIDEEQSTVQQVDMLECVRETTYTLRLDPPPVGGTVDVTQVFAFKGKYVRAKVPVIDGLPEEPQDP